jgi:hypothetical protein
MGLLYKPFGIVIGILAGIAGRQAFNFVWGKISEEEPPEATTQFASLRSVMAATAVQGMIFAVVRALVNRGGARGWYYLTGAWPGERHPEPE